MAAFYLISRRQTSELVLWSLSGGNLESESFHPSILKSLMHPVRSRTSVFSSCRKRFQTHQPHVIQNRVPLVLLFSGAPALASVTPCVSWQRCSATWSLALWLASPRRSQSCWRRPCWLAAGWWASDCQTRGPMSSCRPQHRAGCCLPGVHSVDWITNHLWTVVYLNIAGTSSLLSPFLYLLFDE